MEIIDFFEQDEARRAHWREAIGRADWDAGRLMHRLLTENRLKALCGPATKLLLGVEGDALTAFCTYAEQDEIDCPEMTPWIGFVFTYPEYRGQRRYGALIEHGCALARAEGFERVYISTGWEGLYEKCGFAYLKTMRSIYGGDERVYVRELKR